ncbi:MAG: NYN domain-containing protein [Anaerolineae bacterium]|nr:NYN domain-containing protein [Anaerolineae bacterium]
MPYLIDGHNLIGQMPDLDLNDPHDEAKLVERLKRFMARKGKKCTVIFDGGLPGGPSRDLSTSSVKAVFAHGGTDADRIILERIHDTNDSGKWTVVSADHLIIDAAHHKKMQVIAPAAFVAEMNAATKPPLADGNNPNPHISAREVNDWLRLFGVDPDED